MSSAGLSLAKKSQQNGIVEMLPPPASKFCHHAGPQMPISPKPTWRVKNIASIDAYLKSK